MRRYYYLINRLYMKLWRVKEKNYEIITLFSFRFSYNRRFELVVSWFNWLGCWYDFWRARCSYLKNRLRSSWAICYILSWNSQK